MSGFVAGIQGGYNWQFRCTVFGIEADYNWADLNHDFIFTGPGILRPGAATLAVSSSLQSFGTLRARTGVVVDNLLLYVTSGLAFANTERSVALTVPGVTQLGPFSDEKSRVGWTVGFGTEWAFAPSWSFKSEVLYARFETEENTHTCRLLCNPDRPVRFEHESSAWVTRFGINYRFGGGGYGGVRRSLKSLRRYQEGPRVERGPLLFSTGNVARHSHRSHPHSALLLMKTKTANDDLERTRATLAEEIRRAMDRHKISPQVAHKLTGSPREDFSRLRNGRLERFTLDRMIKILGILDEGTQVSLIFRNRAENKHLAQRW